MEPFLQAVIYLSNPGEVKTATSYLSAHLPARRINLLKISEVHN